MYNELKYITFDGVPIRCYSSWWALSEYATEIVDMDRPDMMDYYQIEILSGWHKYWYLFKYPHIKIR